MKDAKRFYLTCPMCKFKTCYNMLVDDDKDKNAVIVTCASEKGGCDNDFIVAVTKQYSVKEISI